MKYIILLLLSFSTVGIISKYRGLKMNQGDDFLELQYERFHGNDTFDFQSAESKPKIQITGIHKGGKLGIIIQDRDKNIISVINVDSIMKSKTFIIPTSTFSLQLSAKRSEGAVISMQTVE